MTRCLGMTRSILTVLCRGIVDLQAGRFMKMCERGLGEMKKYIAIILTIAMLVGTSSLTWADLIDLSGYDDTALVELLSQVQQEIVNRHIEKTAELPAGKYIGGQDIPAGTFIWTCMAQGDDWGNVTVYSLDADGSHDKQKFWDVAGTPEEGEEVDSFMITVEEGDELESGIPFSLTIYTGAKFH